MGKVVDIIKYEGSNDTFVWRSECEDFNTFTQLIVNESQEAVFYANGMALDLFGPGRHTLKTQNIPMLRSMLRLVTDGETPFHCQVYYINKTEHMAVKWGTDNKVEYMDPIYNFPLSLGASGDMSICVEDSRKLLIKLVGTEPELNRDKLVYLMRGILLVKFKSVFTREIKKRKLNVFDIDEYLDELSAVIHEQLTEAFRDYGLSLERFMIVNVKKPDGERGYEKFKELHYRAYTDVQEAKIHQQVSIINESTKAQRLVMESQAFAAKRKQEGYTYQEERSFDVSEAMANNESIGEYTNMGIGLGVMTDFGASVAGKVTSFVNTTDKTGTCSHCNAQLPENVKFCPECGSEVLAPGYTTCPQCKKTVVKSRFCSECGAALSVSCPGCGKIVEGNMKFCPDCGQKI